MMKKLVLSVLLLNSMALTASDMESENAESKQAIKKFGGTLKSVLVSAIEQEGLTHAIGVCNVEAPEIASLVSTESGVTVSRTSLKFRNPKNAPENWQETVLEEFESGLSAGQSINELEYAEIVDADSGKEYRFMKAIPTGDVCLACHGKTIGPDVAAKIQELYPQDNATGYSKGDIRGAFVVTKKLD